MRRVIGGRKRLAIIVLAAAIAIVGTACLPDTGPPPTADPYQRMLFDAVNRDRAANGLPALTFSPKLSVLAGGHSCDMARSGSMYHSNLGATMASADFGAYWTLGENVLVVGPGTPISTMESIWMNSAPHRANILSGNFNVVGMAFCNGPDGRIWATQEFGGL